MEKKSDPLAALRRVMEGEQWVALDTETTGLGPGAELVEIALVGADGGEYQRLVRPSAAVSKAASRVHRIDPAALAAAPPFSTIAAEVGARLARRTVIGYHVDFDRRILWRELARAGRPAPPCRWLCLCELMIRLTGRRLSLDEALRRLGVAIDEPRHRALGDARAAVALARALAADAGGIAG